MQEQIKQAVDSVKAEAQAKVDAKVAQVKAEVASVKAQADEKVGEARSWLQKYGKALLAGAILAALAMIIGGSL